MASTGGLDECRLIPPLFTILTTPTTYWMVIGELFTRLFSNFTR